MLEKSSDLPKARTRIVRVVARLNVGGPARHVVWLTAGLQTSECDTLLVAGTVPAGEDDMGYFAEEMGVTPFYVREMSREVSLKDAFTVWKLFRLFLRERPDIVHTHTAKAGTVGRLAGLLYRWSTPASFVGRPRICHFVHTYHGHIFHSYYGKAKTRLFVTIERVLARLGTDRIIVISEQQRREINEVFRIGRSEQFAVIPLGIDLNAYANWSERRGRVRDELHAADDDLLVGIVGRLTEIKNHKLFLQVAARVKAIRSAGPAEKGARRVRFVIIGDGKLRPELETQAKSLSFGDNVVFLGTRNDPENFYPALDIVALTSLNEGTPLTLIEAMANARPVIATEVGGVVDLLGQIVSPGNAEPGYRICERGLLAKSGDAEGLARGLARLIEDESLRIDLGVKGRDFVLRNYAKERLLADMTQLYGQLIPTNPASEGATAAPGTC